MHDFTLLPLDGRVIRPRLGGPTPEVLPVPVAAFQVVSRTVWGEARGEGPTGMLAVAWVIRNRAERPGWWGHDVSSVCLAREQFSCWNEDDPNRHLIDSAAYEGQPSYRLAQRCVDDVLSGRCDDLTLGAQYYCVSAIAGRVSWVPKMVETIVIGRHTFYKEPV